MVNMTTGLLLYVVCLVLTRSLELELEAMNTNFIKYH